MFKTLAFHFISIYLTPGISINLSKSSSGTLKERREREEKEWNEERRQ